MYDSLRLCRSLFLACLVLGCGAAPSASDAGARPDASEDGGEASVQDAQARDAARPGDGGSESDAARPDAGVSLECLGERRPLTLAHGLPFTSVRVGAGGDARSGLFLLDLATTASVIDLSAFSPAPMASGCDPSRLGERCTFADLDFFGSWGSVTLVTQDLSGLDLGGVREAGILATDFFSVVAITVDYEASEVRRAARGSLCSDALLRAAGFAALPTTGFYASDLSALRPMRDVDSSAPSGVSVPNVPTVPVRIAGVQAFAQLDTGFDDTLAPRTINVNRAFFDAISSADPGALIRDAASDLALTTCVVGVSESVSAYRVAPGRVLEFIDDAGAAAIAFDEVRVFVKESPAAARRCGGIGTWTAPAAQVAASLHVAMGQVIFDPFTSRVWAPR